MLASTRGIVLRYIKYKETSIITTVYTEKFGVNSYIINGIRSPRSKRSLAYFQPLMLLDLVVYHKNNREIQRISEWKSSSSQSSVYTDVKKSTISLFLSEVLYKSIKEQEPNEATFQFVFYSLELFDQLQEGVTNFHLQFLVKMARYLGFATDHYVSRVSSETEDRLRLLNQAPYGEIINISHSERKETLEYLIRYYQEHTEGFGNLKSYEVLKELFS